MACTTSLTLEQLDELGPIAAAMLKGSEALPSLEVVQLQYLEPGTYVVVDRRVDPFWDRKSAEVLIVLGADLFAWWQGRPEFERPSLAVALYRFALEGPKNKSTV